MTGGQGGSLFLSQTLQRPVVVVVVEFVVLVGCCSLSSRNVSIIRSLLESRDPNSLSCSSMLFFESKHWDCEADAFVAPVVASLDPTTDRPEEPISSLLPVLRCAAVPEAAEPRVTDEAARPWRGRDITAFWSTASFSCECCCSTLIMASFSASRDSRSFNLHRQEREKRGGQKGSEGLNLSSQGSPLRMQNK